MNKIKLLQSNDLEPLLKTCPNQDTYTLERYFKPIQKIPYLKRLKMAIDLINGQTYDNFLEIGFGSGILLPELASRTKKLTAIDKHNYIETVRNIIKTKNIQADLLKADILNMPFPDNTFDGILCLSVLEFVEDIPQAIREIKRIAKPKAKIIIGSPVLNFLTDFCYKIIDYKQHSQVHKSNHKAIINNIKNNFKIKKISRYPAFLPLNLSLFFVLETTKK
ncbi:MAG: class I SAM-dependent methyltransferase [Nanoarchaeota archaeon]|nr:class I SAM-dependent methyltransferase [Nanoarchaeota archaeon]